MGRFCFFFFHFTMHFVVHIYIYPVWLYCAHGIIITQFNHTNSGVCILLCILTCHLYACTLKIHFEHSVFLQFNYGKIPYHHLIILLCEICCRIFFFFLSFFSLFILFIPLVLCYVYSMKAYGTPRPTPIFSTCNRSFNCISLTNLEYFFIFFYLQ